MVDGDFVTKTLTLLFGQVGVLGTILIAVCGLLLWLFHKEQLAHANTRDRYEATSEKRMELYASFLTHLEQLKNQIALLEATLRGARHSRDESDGYVRKTRQSGRSERESEG